MTDKTSDVSNDNPAPAVEVNLPFGHIPRCACDQGTGPALSRTEYRVKVAECKLRGGPCLFAGPVTEAGS